jgi:hypothetical protein
MSKILYYAAMIILFYGGMALIGFGAYLHPLIAIMSIFGLSCMLVALSLYRAIRSVRK